MFHLQPLSVFECLPSTEPQGLVSLACGASLSSGEGADFLELFPSSARKP